MEQATSDGIRAALETVLPRVQGPSRYIGLERNLTRKPWESVAVRVALTFPDVYEIGMSHVGSHILYHLVNRRDDALAERAYAPMPDMAEAMRQRDLPLYTLESYRPVRDFDIVGISLQSELNYINVPYLLDLAGIARRAADRTHTEPLVLGGGPCTANPEPVADFFDAVLIGDAEGSLDGLLDTVRDARADGAGRKELLRRLARLPGVYVPGFYRWSPVTADRPARWEVVDDAAPMPVRRVWVEALDPRDAPQNPVVPFADVVQDRIGMEIMRGCTQGCRFCQAGYWYRPVREHDPDTVLTRLEQQVEETGLEEVSLLSLSSADYSQVEPLVSKLSQGLQDQRVSVSLPSLRADSFSVGLADAVSRIRKSGFTFAPETGSDRLRRVLNKTFTNEDMVRAAEAAFHKGWNLIKVYAMVGLPTESDDDLRELANLAADLVKCGRRIRGRRVEVKVSASPFVPKPWTPFQWQPYVEVEEQLRRLRLLKQLLAPIRGVRFTWGDPDRSMLEAMLSRGDRRLAATIERAYELGSVLDGWSDYIDLSAWRQAIADTGIDLDSELGPRRLDETLPWDHIDAGVRKGFLAAEWRRAQREVATEDCRWGSCLQCGIPGDGADIRLAHPTVAIPGDDIPPDAQPAAAAYTARQHPRLPTRPETVAQPAVYRRYRFTFSKRGDARFLSHRQLMTALERALRASKVPVRYTEGFNPHIRLSMGPPLSLGHEGLAELFDVDCTAPVRPRHVEAANRLLPVGVRLDNALDLLPGAPSIGKMAAASSYRVATRDGVPWPGAPDRLDESVQAGVHHWELGADGSLRVELNLRQDNGPTPTIKTLLSALGVGADELPLVRVTRELLVLRRKERKS